MEVPFKIIIAIILILAVALILITLMTGWSSSSKSALEDFFQQLAKFI